MKDHTSGRDHLLILDCGDFSGGSTEKDKLKAKYLLQGLSELKYDAINLGERDFLLGPNFLLAMKKKYGLPFISANVFYSDSEKHFTEPYIIIKLEGHKFGDIKIESLKIGIFGVMMNRSKLVFKNDEPKLITKEPIIIAEKIVKELKGKCDLIIALAHLNSSQINNLIMSVKGIDIVIGSHDYMRKVEESTINNVIVVQTGYKGQNIGDLKVNLDNNKKVVSFDGEIVALEEKIQDDPAFDNILSEYERESKKSSEKVSKTQ